MRDIQQIPHKYPSKILRSWDFPDGAVVKNPLPSAGDVGSIPGQGTKSHMHATTKSLHAATKEPSSRN